MKYSQYNTLIQLSDNISTVYNAKSDKFVIIKNTIKNHLLLLPNKLRVKNKLLFEELKQAEIIIEDQVDEFNNTKILCNTILKNEQVFKLMLNPTLDCNLKCWYCYETHIKGSQIEHQTAESIKKFIENTFSELDTMHHFQLYLFGGEPLLGFRKTKPLIEFISQNCSKYQVSFGVTITTNGVLIVPDIIRFLKKCTNDICFQITLDGGKNFITKLGLYLMQ